MPVQITLTYETPEAAASALARLAGVIQPEDRPDAGAFPGPGAPSQVAIDASSGTLRLVPATAVRPDPVDPATVFGLPGPSTVVALPAIPPTPLPVPSTAVAAPSSTAPAVPPAISPAAPSVPAAPAATPAPLAAAPTAPAIPTSPAGVVEPLLDSSGLPWDDRIHSSPSKKGDPKPVNADGTWRKKRGTADTYYREIESQLRAARAANAAAVPGAVVAPAVPAAAPAAVPPAPVVAPAVTPPAPVVPAVPAVPPAPPSITFAQMVMKFEKYLIGMSAEQLVYVGSLISKHGPGFKIINDLIHAPNVVPLFDADMSAWLGVAPGPVAAAT